MSSCERGYGIVGYPVCSGNGKCVDGFCVCHSGWTSIGDFALIDGYDCDIHIPTIRGMGIVAVVVVIPVIILGGMSLYRMYREWRVSAAEKYIIAVFASALCGFFRFTLKIIDPVKYSADNSVLSSMASILFVFCLNWVISWKFLQVISFLQASIKFQSHRDRVKTITLINEKIFTIFPFIILISTTIVLMIGTVGLQHRQSRAIGNAYYGILLFNFVICLISGSITFSVSISSINDMRKITMKLHSNSDHDDIQPVIDKAKAQFSSFLMNMYSA